MRRPRFDGATDPGDDTSGMPASSPPKPPSMPPGLTEEEERDFLDIPEESDLGPDEVEVWMPGPPRKPTR